MVKEIHRPAIIADGRGGLASFLKHVERGLEGNRNGVVSRWVKNEGGEPLILLAGDNVSGGFVAFRAPKGGKDLCSTRLPVKMECTVGLVDFF